MAKHDFHTPNAGGRGSPTLFVLVAATVLTLAVLAAPVAAAIPTPRPAAVSYWARVPQFGLYDNNSVADCALASVAALEQVWNAELGGSGAVLPSAPIVARYLSIAGGTNTGMYLDVALSTWESGIDGVKIAADAPISPDRASVETAIWQLGGVLAMVRYTSNEAVNANKPTSLADKLRPWTLDQMTASLSGAAGSLTHVVAVVGYDRSYLYLATWGAVQRVTWSWWNAEEAGVWAVLPESFVTAGHGPISSVASLENAYFQS